MTQIITTNLRQQSDLFEKKPFYLEFSELVVKGDNLEATINKSIIPRVEADKLKQQAQNKNEKQEKK